MFLTKMWKMVQTSQSCFFFPVYLFRKSKAVKIIFKLAVTRSSKCKIRIFKSMAYGLGTQILFAKKIM